MLRLRPIRNLLVEELAQQPQATLVARSLILRLNPQHGSFLIAGQTKRFPINS